MAFTVNYSTDRGKVRLLISDIDPNNPIFEDDAIDAFLDIALDGNVKRAAAQALLTIAANEVYVQKRIRLLDLQTDGPSEASALRALAKELTSQADTEEVTDAFDWAEIVSTPAQYDERIWNERLRNS